MKKLPRPDNTIDFRSILSMNPQQRLDFARTKDGMSFLASLTASEYAKLFPDYYRKQLPDIGQTVMSRPIQGRSWPPPGSSIRNPTYSRPSEGNNVPSSPGTGSTPDNVPDKSAPNKRKENIVKEKNFPVWQGGTSEVNREGELKKKLNFQLSYDIGEQSKPGSWNTRKDIPYDGRPASVRYNNPGASWTRQRDELFGVEYYGIIGGNNRIGRYPTLVHGLASNMDLFSNSKNYLGQSLQKATYTWRGNRPGNVPSFTLSDGTVIDGRTIITPELVKNEEFMYKVFKSYAQHEAGIKNTLSDDQIKEAFKMYSAGGVENYKKQLERDKKTIAEGGDILPPLALPTDKALNPPVDNKPKKTYSKPSPIGFGDSVMNQILTKNKVIEKGYARDGAAPAEILSEIKKMDAAKLKGRDVYLSTGLLNNPKDLDAAREMIKYVKENGGTVTLVGGPQGDGTRDDLKDVHKSIEQLGTEMGVKTTPAYTPAPDGVHVSNQFLGKLIPAVTPITNSGVPLSYGTGIVGNEKIAEEENRKRPTYMPGRISFEGFEDDNLKNTSFIAGSGGQEAYPSIPYGTYKLSPQRTGGIISNYYSRHGIDPTKGAFSKVFNVGTPENITSTGYDPKVDRRRSEIQIHSNVRNDVRRLVSSGCLTVTPGDYPKLVASIEKAMEASGGNVSLVVENDGSGGARYKIVPSYMTPNAQTVSEAIQESGVSPAVPSVENKEPSKLMFNTSRAYTESEVKSMVDKYGKNLIIGANMDDPKEYEQVRALAEKYGVRMHGYSMGRGAPQSSWGNQFPDEQKEIQRRAKEMGISVDQWYSGGWMDYEINRLKALGNKAPAQIELDNINDAKSASDLEKELLKFDKFRQESGIKTQIVPKNFNTREYEVYNKLLNEKKIAPDLAVPLNIVESKYVKGAEKPTAEAGHAYGPMPKDNIKEYATQEPLNQPAAGKVKENKYGGDLRSRNSKESTFLVNAQGVLGSVSPGETIDYRGDGRIKVVPNERTNPNELIRQSMDTLMNNDKDAESEIQQNRTGMASNPSPSPMSYSPADWKNEMMKATDLKVFSSVSFERSVRVSRFDKSGDSGLGGHFDTYSTAIS